MSLKFFFNRKGIVVVSLTVIGWIGNFFHFLGIFWQWHDRGAITGFFFLFYLFLAFLITVFRFKPWYKKEDRGAGIEEHLEKTLVPTSYMMVLTNVIYHYWQASWPLLFFMSLLFMVILSVNFILLYFHNRDTDPTPPSYFARSLYKDSPSLD